MVVRPLPEFKVLKEKDYPTTPQFGFLHTPLILGELPNICVDRLQFPINYFNNPHKHPMVTSGKNLEKF